MANTHETLPSLFTDIADAIRSKTGGTEDLVADNFPSAIATIETGIDTSDATAAATDIARGKTAYVNGEKVTGDLYEVTSGSSILTDGEINSVVDDSLRIVSNSMASNRIFRTGSKIRIDVPLRNLGDADASNVQSGKTFTSSAGLKVIGTGEMASDLAPELSDQDGLIAAQDGLISQIVTVLEGKAGSLPAENLDAELSEQDTKIAELQSILVNKASATITAIDDGNGNVTIVTDRVNAIKVG